MLNKRIGRKIQRNKVKKKETDNWKTGRAKNS